MAKIYCTIYNGLGNQLFGYALGLYLAKKYNRQLVIDLTKLNIINARSRSGLKKDTPRYYELDKFGFSDPVVQFNPVAFIRELTWLNGKKRIFTDFREKHHLLNIENPETDIYCIGWGNFQIVKEILPEIRLNFKPKFELSIQLLETIKLIKEKNSIAVHIRRTDFLDPKLSGYAIGICNDKYYSNAIERIRQSVENPFFIFFSDDTEFISENYKLKNSHIIKGNKGYEDLYLMSLCNHFILANSTFSFWGAVLSDNENKMVCVPEYWYNHPLRQADYIPDDWIQISIT